MTTDALRRLQALHGQPRPASAFGALAQVQVDLQTVIEAVLELADENTPPASRNAPQDARSADSGTGGPPEPQNGAQGRIGWLRLYPDDECRYLAREVPGGWDDTDDDDLGWPAKTCPDAEFTPIRTLADDEVAVKRDVVDMVVERLEYARLDAIEDGRTATATALRNSIAALEADR